ncbi:ovostatin homolog isoform X1 [Pimephales promelas]|uniref:ovostatin homolog isoform X1 n=1 Tax=Pimephales promelas TaxID=90988 RepID=UPI001955EDE9|nr:ovostatin homolog isoform X1 [Pimephales promelas]
MGLKVESCAKCTYGQPVPGQALVEVCRDPFPYSLSQTLSDQIMKQTVKMNATGCASLTVDVSVFFNTKFEDQMQDTFLVNVTEEGTDVMVSICNGVLYKQSCKSLGGEQLVQQTSVESNHKQEWTGCVLPKHC